MYQTQQGCYAPDTGHADGVFDPNCEQCQWDEQCRQRAAAKQTGALALSSRELALCAELKIDPRTYAARKAAELPLRGRTVAPTQPARPTLSSTHARRLANSHNVSEREARMCAELGVDPGAYAAQKAAVAR